MPFSGVSSFQLVWLAKSVSTVHYTAIASAPAWNVGLPCTHATSYDIHDVVVKLRDKGTAVSGDVIIVKSGTFAGAACCDVQVSFGAETPTPSSRRAFLPPPHAASSVVH